MTVAGCGPPPEGTAAGWGGSGTRVRDELHDRAQREHAPCKPQRGEHRGCDRRKGRMTTGATRQAPPPPAEGQVPRLVPAPCLRRACTIGRTARTPPPPRPLLLHPPNKRARTARTQRGDMGCGRGQTEMQGGETRGKKKKKQQRTPTRQSGGRQQGQTGHGGSQEARQGARDRGTPLGTKARRQGPTPQRTGGGRGDKSPQKTLVRYPTSGVRGPTRCPYRPHLSTSNQVGYARDRWPAAGGGTGLGGWPMGLTKSTPHGTYCGSCLVRGCG